MALDAIIDSTQLNADLELVADSIRENIGIDEKFDFPEGFVSAMSKDKTQDFKTFIEGSIELGEEGSLDFAEGPETLESENITRIGYYALFQNPSIKSIILPNLLRVENHACCYCMNLEFADLGMVASIGGNGFGGCKKLKTIILRSSDVVECTNTSFWDTPFSNEGNRGVAYVPQDLIEKYQTTGRWYSYYTGGTCVFEPIEGSIYE